MSEKLDNSQEFLYLISQDNQIIRLINTGN